MDIANVAQARYTTKAFDSSKTIPPALIEQLRTLLRNTPSSVNSQPWHFVMAATPEGKARIAKSTQGTFAYNAPKVLNASHVVVLCARTTLDDAHLRAVLAQEQQDGRFATEDAMATQDKTRRFYVDLHQHELGDEAIWIRHQIYLALGSLLLGAATLGIDACPMEGFDASALDAELGLADKGLTGVLLVSLGYRATDDFNAKLPKSRLAASVVISDL